MNMRQRKRNWRMTWTDTRSLVAEPPSNKSDGTSDTHITTPIVTPTNLYPNLRPILRFPKKMMGTLKSAPESPESRSSNSNGNSTIAPPHSALSKPRKSVKFSADAATDDGESRQRIHKALIAAYNAVESTEAITPEELADLLDTTAPPAKKQKREKKKQKKVRPKIKKGGADAASREGALNYLLEYHTSRDTWRFQKAKQNWILRNAFEVDQIEGTEENGEALKAYISGLQSHEARSRLLEEAKQIVEEEVSERRGDGERPEEVKSPGEVGKRKRVERAKLVMVGLGHGDDEEGGAQKDAEGGKGNSDDTEDEESDWEDDSEEDQA